MPDTQLALAEPNGRELVEYKQPTPMDLIQMAVQQGADVDKLEKLMDLKLRWEANEARKAFEDAFTAFKAEIIPLVKDKDNNQYKSKYISLANLVNTVTPFLSKHRLTMRWDIDQTHGIKVTCIVTHAGHSTSASMSCPPDTSGAKNAIQQIKSAITYAKACTFESVCGLASTDANVEDDGNGSERLGERSVEEYLTSIRDASSLAELQAKYEEAKAAASEKSDAKAVVEFLNAKDERYKQLKPAVRR